MNNNSADLKFICLKLLQLYGVSTSNSINDIHDFTSRQSHLYGYGNVYRFIYDGRLYYVSDDYSLMDNPIYLKSLLEEFDHNLQGAPLRNPIPQCDGAKYASGLNGTEYYLWDATASIEK